MKSHRISHLAIAVLALSTAAAFAQTNAQKSFTTLKTLAGSWDGTLSGTGTDMDGKVMHVTLRVTSTGNALMHEMNGLAGRPDDPITMFYVDGDRVMLTHYCDAGNRPRMAGVLGPDGKTLDFEFVDVAGSTQYGHMHHVMLAMGDANHHTEEWTFMEGDKPIHARLDLHRAQ